VRSTPALAAAALAMLLAGCAGFGPGTVSRDRFDYVTSISESWKRQMLLNVLKVRYADAPVFLDVTSVINAYAIEGEISLGGQAAPVDRAGDSFTAIGGVGRYSDRPTITYAPLSGDKYARGVITPVPVSGILLLVQSGYPIDLIFRICVNSINGLQNAYGGVAGRPGDARFHELLDLLREGQLGGGVSIDSSPQRKDFALYLSPAGDAAMSARHRRIAELLRLEPGRQEYRISYGVLPSTSDEVVVQTRSMMQVLTDYASQIELPAQDIAEGRVYDARRSPQMAAMFPPLVQVHHGEAAPADAYAAVRYRNRAFWIDDRDYRSKATLNFVMLMFSLTETGAPAAAPVVTVPAR
jgi:hypothetical protein